MTKEQEKIYKQEYYQLHKMKYIERARKYYLVHQEEIKARVNKYYHLHEKEGREQRKKYYQEHREETKRHSREYYKLHKKEQDERMCIYRRLHREELSKNNKKYVQLHRERINEIKRKCGEKRRKIPRNRINDNISSAIYESLKNKKAGRHWETLVDFILEDLIKYLENLFDDKMNWDNYGSYWDVDHIKPQSLFHYKTAEDPEFKKCWALENLQPLDHITNLKKYNHYAGLEK